MSEEVSVNNANTVNVNPPDIPVSQLGMKNESVVKQKKERSEKQKAVFERAVQKRKENIEKRRVSKKSVKQEIHDKYIADQEKLSVEIGDINQKFSNYIQESTGKLDGVQNTQTDLREYINTVFNSITNTLSSHKPTVVEQPVEVVKPPPPQPVITPPVAPVVQKPVRKWSFI